MRSSAPVDIKLTEVTTSKKQVDDHRPIVSIITPTYNSGAFISETISSVQAQDFPDWEHIIVDDASSDDTVAIVQAHRRYNPRIKLILLESNSGAAVARNSAINVARGRFIAFLDADDLWLPEKLSVQIDYMMKNNAPFTYSSFGLIDEQGNLCGTRIVPEKVSYSEILRNNVIGCLTAVYDTQYFGHVQMPLIRKRQDLGLWLRLLKRVHYADGIPTVLAQYRLRQGSISNKKLSAARSTWRLYRDVERLSLPKATFYFSVYAINGVLKNGSWKKASRKDEKG